MELKKSKTLKEDQGCYLLLFYHWVKNLDRAQWGWLITMVPSVWNLSWGKSNDKK